MNAPQTLTSLSDRSTDAVIITSVNPRQPSPLRYEHFAKRLDPLHLKKTTLDLLLALGSPRRDFVEFELCEGGADVTRWLIESALRAAGSHD